MAGGSSPPPAPDPVKVAEAQTQSNKETSQFQAGINRADQYTPQGSTTWRIAGYWPDGSPKYESTQAYSPGEQNIYDLNNQARANVGQIAVDQSSRIGNMLGTPLDLSNENVSGYLMDLGRKRMDPMFDERWQRQEQDLANKGISMGSDAYGRARTSFDQSRNDAYNQLLLSGRAQGVQEMLAARNQPINETTALMSGSQVSQPSFVGNPQTGVANTDVAGIYNNNYNQQMAAYNAEQSQGNAMMGGLFGMGASALRFLPFSDARLKKDIVRTGETGPKGLAKVEWTYIWGGPRYRGYIAQEVLPLFPSAVHFSPEGFMALDYSRIV